TGHLGRELAFRLRSAAKISGSAHIHDQHHCQLAFLGEFFHEGAAHPRSDVPIYRANFVARLILAHVFKVHAASFENAVVITGECGFDQTAGFDFECSDFLEDLSCFLSPLVIPSGAKRSRGIPWHYRESPISGTAYIFENKSRHSGFLRAMSASFFARLQRLSCFSLAIALVGSGYASK